MAESVSLLSSFSSSEEKLDEEKSQLNVRHKPRNVSSGWWFFLLGILSASLFGNIAQLTLWCQLRKAANSCKLPLGKSFQFLPLTMRLTRRFSWPGARRRRRLWRENCLRRCIKSRSSRQSLVWHGCEWRRGSIAIRQTSRQHRFISMGYFQRTLRSEQLPQPSLPSKHDLRLNR